eukprot:TRINITY_DN566_c1_g4_i1.p1 TRINITY_DN566_c1_g4~~TRINITY_DN566_c1_g4_i1.p1  ORF type:complete len:1163 (-),score=255.03 TRINITY_DN566_c1_g4_i1:273-3761(-)
MSDDDSVEFFSEDDEDDYEDDDGDEDDAFEFAPSKSKEEKPKAKAKAKAKAKSKASPSPRKSPAKSATKKTAKAKKKSSDSDMEDEEEDSFPVKKSIVPKKKSNKTNEDIYQKLDQREHVLKRPDTYVGSIEKKEDEFWVFDAGVGMVNRKVEFVPGLYKIFDEILVNAADNKQRDDSMDAIKVEISREDNTISVWNNGQGIPIAIHAKEKIYIPDLIFGTLLAGANFDDEEKKVVGGRNGYGAKLANIFSTEFTVETSDSTVKKKYKQVWKNNMQEKTEPKITSYSGNDYTKITFKPDLKKFGMTELDKNTIALFTKRVYDIAGCNPTVKVSLNGERVGPMKSFASYIALYFPSPKESDASKITPIYKRVNERWEVAVAFNPEGQFQQVSFVNSINTIKGGTHVNYIADKIVKYLIGSLSKKSKKDFPIKPFQVKNYMWLFVNCLIENPAFDSQTKETLTTKVSNFGSTCEFDDTFLKKVKKCGIIDAVLTGAQAKKLVFPKTKKKGRLAIEKLDDANYAGKKGATQCTLILTEGDSAKSLAVSGLSVVGRDYYGVFPLRGKLLNVREANQKQIGENAELNNLIRILGLQSSKDYHDVKDLRYGHLMIMTDQDHDGSHIKGLLINFIHNFWPSLLKIPGFMTEFVTPIVKAKKGKQEETFFTLTEYNAWKERTNNGKGWSIKYYKGLGTSTAAEAKEYFSDIYHHKIDFAWGSESDGNAIDLAFSKKRADDRKEWIGNFQPGTYVDHSVKKLTYSDFINKELVQFSVADNVRSIPSMVDGLKPGQRKILFCCFKRNLKSDIKVAQLSGYVSEHSAYHHGEASLHSTIVNMAQNFVGSNNINLLYPSGQFGTRLNGGKDSASARYIFTRLSELTRFIYREEDDALLEYLDDDGQSIEPKWYIPILPMVLVNGSEGIGTGWSTFTPNYNPRDIVANLKRLINGQEPEKMTPWYKGFKGQIRIEKSSDDGEQFTVSGTWLKEDSETLRITELPIGTWTSSYKQFLESSIVGNVTEKKTPQFLKDYKEHHTDTTVDFTLEIPAENMEQLEKDGIEKKLKLSSKISNTNIHLFDSQGRIKKYNPLSVLEEFYSLRVQYYEMRKQHLIDVHSQEYEKLSNKVRFIIMVINAEYGMRFRRSTMSWKIKCPKVRCNNLFPKMRSRDNRL